MRTIELAQVQVWWSRHRALILHFAVLATGVLARESFEHVHQGASYRLNAVGLLLALAGSVATFPAFCRVLEHSRSTSPWLRLLVAFQYGFCWRAVLGIEV